MPRVNDLPTASSFEDDDYVVVLQDGVTKKAPSSEVASILGAATEAEALAGSDNTAMMTPLRVKQVLPSVVVYPSGDTTGVTDKANMTAAATGAPRTITLAAGIFYVNGYIPLYSDNHWRGPGATIKIATGSTDGKVFYYGAGGQSNFSISDLTIDGNKANITNAAAQAAVNFINGTNMRLTRCRIIDTTHAGLYVYQGSNVLIEGSDFDNNGTSSTTTGANSGIRVGSDTVDVRIIGNRVRDSTDTCIYCESTGLTVISGNTIQTGTYIGIGLAGGHAAHDGSYTISGNSISDITGNGIDSGDATDVSIVGNTLVDTGGICPDLSATAATDANINITGNTVINGGTVPIFVIGGGHSGFTVSGNVVSGTFETGIMMAHTIESTVSGNSISGATTRGIYVYKGADEASTHLAITGNTIKCSGTTKGIESDSTSNDYILAKDNLIVSATNPLAGSWGANCDLTGNMYARASGLWPAPSTLALWLPGTSGNYVSRPDGADLEITGDITIVAHIAAADWSPSALQMIVARRVNVNSHAYRLYLNTSGTLALSWSTDGGEAGGLVTSTSTSNLSALANYAPKWVAATLDVNNGGGGRDTRFWTSDDGQTWTQLGSTVNVASTTSIYGSSASPLEIGAMTGGTQSLFVGVVHLISIRNGIGASGVVGGSEVACYDASEVKNPLWTDAYGSVFTHHGTSWGSYL